MGSLQLTKSDMDGANASPCNFEDVEKIKAILHRDVDKELQHAIKIAKEINSRIYQVHRNIIVHKKCGSPHIGSVTKVKAVSTDTFSHNDELGEGSWSERSCDSNKFEDSLRTDESSSTKVSSPSKFCALNHKSTALRQSPRLRRHAGRSPEKFKILKDPQNPDASALEPVIAESSSKYLSMNNENSQNITNSIVNNSVENLTELNKSLRNDEGKNSRNDETNFESQSNESDLQSLDIESLWLLCLDHDYLKENVWAHQINHERLSQSSLNEMKPAPSNDSSSGFSNDDFEPPYKKNRIEVITDEKNSPKTSASDFIQSGVNVDDVKYEDFLSSSSYFDNDFMVFNETPFSHNNIDLSSICDISSLNFKVDYDRLGNSSVSTSDPAKDYIWHDKSVDSSRKSESSQGLNVLNGTSSVKLRFTIGTVSKLLLASEKSCHETHIWKIYVRNTYGEDASLDNYIAKVRFVIHDSYAPNNLIERKEPPYEITRRGWGEFPIRVQIFFRYNKKPICLVHQLTLVQDVINILTLGIQKNYEIIIPNTVTSSLTSGEKGTNQITNNGQWKNSSNGAVMKNMFDFKIKEINTIAKINELISQDPVPSSNDASSFDNLSQFNASLSSIFPFKDLKSQLLGERDFFTNFSDLNQMKIFISSIKNYYERIIFLLDVLPIITPHASLKWYKRVYPFSCPSKNMFESWPIGKQRASEFSRARMIKTLAAIDPAQDWSTNEIVLFARNKDSHFKNDPVAKGYFISFSKSLALQQLMELEKLLSDSDSNEFIDVL